MCFENVGPQQNRRPRPYGPCSSPSDRACLLSFQNSYGSVKKGLCLTEKYHIITSELNLLNKHSELMSKCRHENKFLTKNFIAIEDTP